MLAAEPIQGKTYLLNPLASLFLYQPNGITYTLSLWQHCTRGVVLILLRLLTLSKSEPTFAVTSSTSVYVSMLTILLQKQLEETP